MFVLTIDQRHSRRDEDRVGDVLQLLNRPDPSGLLRNFERTAGDEVQGVLDDASLVVDIALALVRNGHWSIGIGVGPVRHPLPSSARAGAGPAYESARIAVDRAKSSPERLAVEGQAPVGAEEAQAVLGLLSAVVQRRSPAGWQAVDLMTTGLSQKQAAAQLGITKQALSQRLQVALWPHEVSCRPAVATLLARVDVSEGHARMQA